MGTWCEGVGAFCGLVTSPLGCHYQRRFHCGRRNRGRASDVAIQIAETGE